MILVFHLVLCLCFVGASYARTDMERRNWFTGLGVDCLHDYPIQVSEMKMLLQHKVPNSDNAKCLLGCVYRKASWMDDKGMFDLVSINAMMDKEFADDADTTKRDQYKKLLDFCKKVNDEPAKDGDKGCERATTFTICFIENASKMGIALL